MGLHIMDANCLLYPFVSVIHRSRPPSKNLFKKTQIIRNAQKIGKAMNGISFHNSVSFYNGVSLCNDVSLHTNVLRIRVFIDSNFKYLYSTFSSSIL